jgi:hypothetical protein
MAVDQNAALLRLRAALITTAVASQTSDPEPDHNHEYAMAPVTVS